LIEWLENDTRLIFLSYEEALPNWRSFFMWKSFNYRNIFTYFKELSRNILLFREPPMLADDYSNMSVPMILEKRRLLPGLQQTLTKPVGLMKP